MTSVTTIYKKKAALVHLLLFKMNFTALLPKTNFKIKWLPKLVLKHMFLFSPSKLFGIWMASVYYMIKSQGIKLLSDNFVFKLWNHKAIYC